MPHKNERMQSALERALRFALVGLAAGVAAGVAFAAPIWLTGGTERGGGGAVGALLIGFPLGGLLGGLLVGVLREALGGLVDGSLRGRGGRGRSEYSHAQSLVIRGAYAEAVELYETAARENPADPEPLLLGARVLRSHLARHDEAVEWLRRARDVAALSPHQDVSLTRELVSLYEGPLQCPEKAIPELARLAGSYPGTSAATWAMNRLSGLRAARWTDVRVETED